MSSSVKTRNFPRAALIPALRAYDKPLRGSLTKRTLGASLRQSRAEFPRGALSITITSNVCVVRWRSNASRQRSINCCTLARGQQDGDVESRLSLVANRRHSVQCPWEQRLVGHSHARADNPRAEGIARQRLCLIAVEIHHLLSRAVCNERSSVEQQRPRTKAWPRFQNCGK